ncbi:MAG: diguanylate cyclase [Deltaproteobacteria bacterium]|nr:diguanylate cyclase [Deltaproteobacteria bacterium]
MHSILIADDDEDIRKLLKVYLKKLPYKIYEAVDGKEALVLVDKYEPDIILLDVDMPMFNGFEVSRTIRENQKFSLIYIIFVTSRSHSDDKVLGFNVGADDYITKPFDPKELKVRMERGIRHLNERKNANIDSLTGLYNRYFFNVYLVQIIESSKRYKQKVSMILIDIDFFKKVNDTYGHSAGDKILVEVALFLKGFCRKTDIACRWGGEEFVLLLPNTENKDAAKIAERVRSEIESMKFPVIEKLTVSLGVAEFQGDEELWFQNADLALYNAKESGRNKVIVL